ncbi:MAG: hypothetical protein C1943_07420 [Halochromatium sp.]|nr:hypothetical protein [Halochromatium sp.]
MPVEQAPQFPNPDQTPRLVLYPISGGVALDWRLDPALIQQARTAFAAHQPVAKLLLHPVDADGTRLAEAEVVDLDGKSAGQARFLAPVVGPVQAELGLEGQPDGGWLLLARSNRLDAVPEPAQLPIRDSLVKAAEVTRFPDPSLAALAARPELRGSAFPLAPIHSFAQGFAEQDIEGASVSTSALSEQRPQAGETLASGSSVQAERVSEQPSEAASEQEVLDQPPPKRQDVAPLESRAARGSGPMAPYPSGADALIQGELHVFGRATPGSLLDLGGHPYRVGPGGRFSFRVALDDPELLAALLARLPALPVAEREP